MSSEHLASAQNELKGNLGGAWNILDGAQGQYQDLGIARRFGGAAAAYSLRDIGAMNGRVVKVRRNNDSTEEDFSANQIQSGVLEDFCDNVLTVGTSVNGTGSFSNYEFTANGNTGFDADNSAGGTGSAGFPYTFKDGDIMTVTYTVTNFSSESGLSPQIRGTTGTNSVTQVASGGTTFTANGTYTDTLTASADGTHLMFADGNTGSYTISNFAVTSHKTDGLVETWYDQSGNGFDLKSQSADTQPFIVSNGVFTGGVYSPSRTSNSTKQYLEVSSPDFDSTDITSSKFGWLSVMANMEENVDGGAGVIFGNTRGVVSYGAGSIALNLSDTNGGRLFVSNAYTTSAADFIGSADDTDLFDSETIGTAVVDGSSLSTFLNGNTGSGTFSNLTLTSTGNFRIFQSNDGFGGLRYQTASQGFIKELMFMQGDTIDDIVTIRNEVNNHYNIF